MMLSRVRGLVSLLVVFLAVFFAGVQWFVLPPTGWVTGDQGSKYLQTRAFAVNGPLDPGIEVLSRDIDPDYRYQEPKMKNRRGRLVSEFLWLLPLITAPFYRAFGMRGLYVVPALAVIVTALAAAALGRRLAGTRHAWLAWIAVCATPVIVYGLEFWEHAPAVACVMVAGVLAFPERTDRRRETLRLLGAGAAIAVGVLFREEVAAALPAFIVARALVIPDHRFKALIIGGLWGAAGALLVFVAAVPINLLIYGAPLPMHMTQDAWEVAKSVPYLQVRRDIIYGLFLPADHVAIFLAAAVTGLAAAVIQRRRRGGPETLDDRPSRRLLTVVHIAVIAMVTIAVALPIWSMVTVGARGNAYRITSAAHTWVFAFPLLYWPWFRVHVDRVAGRFLLVSALLLMAGTFILIPTDGGSQWSPRFFLAAVPLLAIVAGAAVLPPGGAMAVRISGATWRPVAALVLLASLVMQATGAGWVKHGKQHTARLSAWVANYTRPGEVLISNVFWFPEVTATLAPTRRMLFSWSGEQVPAMAAAAVAGGFHQFRTVTSPQLTDYDAPAVLDLPGAPCRFVRAQPIVLAELLISEYSCAPR
jgi:hypothetical protein